MNAVQQGLDPPRPESMMARVAAAASHDADVFRALVETAVWLALPAEAFTRPDQGKIEQDG